MLVDQTRAVLQSPVRKLLRRVAAWGALPDEHELAELDIDDASIDKLRECVDVVSQIAEQGGMRSRHKAGETADRLAAALLAEVPRGFAGRVAPATPDLPGDDPGCTGRAGDGPCPRAHRACRGRRGRRCPAGSGAAGAGHRAVTSTADRAYQCATGVLRSLAAVGAPASICEPEKLGGRCSGRVRIVMREDYTHALTAVLADYLDRVADPADADRS